MNGAFVFPGLDDPHGWNSPALLTAGIPATGAVSSARGLAGLYAAAATGLAGAPRLLARETVTEALRDAPSDAAWSGMPDFGMRWGVGFARDSAVLPLLGPRSFGHAGSGGPLGFGDDEYGVGFGYVASEMVGYGDPRAGALIAAVRESLG